MAIPKVRKPKRTGSRFPATSTWQLQAAKTQFSEVIRRALKNGPQVITKQGEEEVVILPIDQYKRLVERSKQPHSLVKFFAESPLAGAELDLNRKPDYGRTVNL